MAHANLQLVQRGYEAFGRGDIPALLEVLAGDIAWHVSGRSAVSGDYKGHEEVVGLFTRLMERSGGTFNLEIHDFTASDDHVVVLTRESAQRGAASVKDDTVHIWHVKDGKATEFWTTSFDQYASDEFWGYVG
jgi:ketosteroid isomerase-like protein